MFIMLSYMFVKAYPTHALVTNMIFSPSPNVECNKLLPLESHPRRRDDGHLQHHLLLHLHEGQVAVASPSSFFTILKTLVRLKKRHAFPWRWVKSKFNH